MVGVSMAAATHVSRRVARCNKNGRNVEQILNSRGLRALHRLAGSLGVYELRARTPPLAGANPGWLQYCRLWLIPTRKVP